ICLVDRKAGRQTKMARDTDNLLCFCIGEYQSAKWGDDLLFCCLVGHNGSGLFGNLKAENIDPMSSHGTHSIPIKYRMRIGIEYLKQSAAEFPDGNCTWKLIVPGA